MNCWALAAAALLVALGLHLVYQAKSAGLAEIDQGLASKQLAQSQRADRARRPAAGSLDIPDQHAREEAARQIYYVSGSLGNVGALARIPRALHRRAIPPIEAAVRGPPAGQFPARFYRWAACFFAAFLLVHIWWSASGFRGDQLLLPVGDAALAARG